MEVNVNNIIIEANYELFEVVVTDGAELQSEKFALAAANSALEAEASANNSESFSILAESAKIDAEAARLLAEGSKNEAQASATLSTEQAILSASARNDAEAARLGAENAEDNALISEINAATSANNALASEQASEAIFTNTQSLLLNFFDDAIIALNSRIVADGGIVVIKLRFVQQELDEIYAL